MVILVGCDDYLGKLMFNFYVVLFGCIFLKLKKVNKILFIFSYFKLKEGK